MCKEFPFPLLLTEAFIMFQCAQVGSVLDSCCTQTPLLSPVTKMQLENSFIDVHGPNPVIQHGMLMQFQGYMAFPWTCICEVKAEPDFEGVPGSFLMLATIMLGKGGVTSLLLKAEVTHWSWLNTYQPLKFQPLC